MLKRWKQTPPKCGDPTAPTGLLWLLGSVGEGWWCSGAQLLVTQRKHKCCYGFERVARKWK
jgi:hypothetical protein